MKNILQLLSLQILLISHVYGQAPDIQWQKCLGGTDREQANDIQITPDGGYIITGYTLSNDGDVSGNNGNHDYWVAKLDAAGTLQWQKALGGTGSEDAFSVQNAVDGGYIVAGWSTSMDGDVSGNHGFRDYWIVKLDPSGTLQWQKCLGGTDDDGLSSFQITTDGGYIAAGYTNSNDGNVSGNNGGFDFWVVKTNATGVIQWQKCLGGSFFEGASSIQATSDGGYIVAGNSQSNDGDVSGNHGNQDYWIVKLDASGTIQWQKCLGGSETEVAHDIQITPDGGYFVAGSSQSNDGDVSGNNGGDDCWVVKLNAAGAIQWQKSLGGSGYDQAIASRVTPDGGFVVAANTDSNDGDVSGFHGLNDIWIVKLDATGDIQWQKSLGGTNWESAPSIQIAGDGGYAVAGLTYSNDGDVSGNHGDGDFWVLKLAPVLLNDEACSAILIPADGTVQAGFSNVDATVASGENAIVPPNLGNNCIISWCEQPNSAINNSVWFSFVAPSTGAVEVSTCDMADFDTQIAVYSVGDCSNFGTYNLLSANDDGPGCSGYSSRMNVEALTAGQTYYIIVDGYDGATGGFSIQVSPITVSATHELFANSPLLAVYPNPSSGQLTIRLENKKTMNGYSLIDLTGKTIIDVQLEQAMAQTEVEFGQIPKGVYLLKVRSGGLVFSEMIILQ